MNLIDFSIRQYENKDKDSVIQLWQKCNLIRPWNNPEREIERKLKFSPDLFLVGTNKDKIIATVMGGYEGRRGWVNYVAVDPSYQRKGIGKLMMSEIENKLLEQDCPKLNLQVRVENSNALAF